MKKRYQYRMALWAWCALLLTGCAKEIWEPFEPQADFKGFHYRDGLPNFFRRVQAGNPVTVAYFGGSITASNDGWRDLTFDWLKTTYPDASFKQVNAGLGGTGSDLGVFRMDNDLLGNRPDLVFVEFASNDTGTPEAIYRSMEGIVRKTWRKYPGTDICFVYTVIESNLPALQAGNYQPTAEAMEKIAEHYGIPSIHMGIPVVELLDSGKLVFTGKPADYPGKLVFTNDGTHPQSVAAHTVYAEAAIRALKEMASFATVRPHALQAPYINDNWENALAVSLDSINTRNGWERLPAGNAVVTQFSQYQPDIYKAIAPGASFTVRFRGKTLGVYDVVGPASGIVDVTIDGNPAIEVYRFDAWANYYRLHNFFLKELPEGDHEVRFLVTGKAFDKAAILARRNITINYPAEYSENSWFVGKILILGKLLE